MEIIVTIDLHYFLHKNIDYNRGVGKRKKNNNFFILRNNLKGIRNYEHFHKIMKIIAKK